MSIYGCCNALSKIMVRILPPKVFCNIKRINATFLSFYLSFSHFWVRYRVSSSNSTSADINNKMGDKEIDPFFHELKLSTFQWLRTLISGVVLIPVRLSAVFVLAVVGWIFSSLSLLGLSESEAESRPLSRIRRFIFMGEFICLKLMGFACGITPFYTKNKPKHDENVPIYVCAPHTTFFDSFVPCHIGPVPYLVCRSEDKKIPLFGKAMRAGQNIFVDRSDPNSKEKTRNEIVKRSSTPGWHPLCIFPDGSIANGKALMEFKTGAFQPGLPVQPVLVRFLGEPDTTTWTWKQKHGVFTIICTTLAKLFTPVELEFLPIYRPNAEEKNDSRLFANNVRKVMAKGLGIPLCPFTYEEAKAKFGRSDKKTKKS